MRFAAMLRDVVRSLVRRPVTRRYPRERVPAPERLRGALRWDPAHCTGCAMCARDCPASAIEVITLDKATKRFVLRYHIDRCTFCAQCVRTCNFGCLEMSPDQWELAVPCKERLTVEFSSQSSVVSSQIPDG